jgi:aminopeptidase N
MRRGFMSEPVFRYNRSDFAPLAVTLRHLDIQIDFHPAHIDGIIVLHVTAREPMSVMHLDARHLDLSEVAILDDAGDSYAALVASHEQALTDSAEPCEHTIDGDRLHITLPRTVAAGDTLRVRCRARSIPSDALLEGIYKDTTPPGAPQQYMSQCQQWGFQRILPIYDDCTAKCTMVTTLSGDARYTHMISNGNICAQRHPGGVAVSVPGSADRKQITFINPVPMAPYLFVACAGTWDQLDDAVRYPSGQQVKLEYLVTPGHLEGARLPMEILKHSVLWQHESQEYAYRHDVYRTITMDKSNFGGMENVGNTTIVTDAALIDEFTTDGRLEYAYAVILHEFEHNQCGSDVTMETPFDMWLNEGFTVDVERQYISAVFDPAAARLGEVDDIRSPIGGPLAIEDAGHVGNIVRDGFNDPDELVDGVTYVKSAEVIRMLRLIIGNEAFRSAKNLYFKRYDGANANTDQFFDCFEEASGRDLTQFKREWLYTIGYPQVTATSCYSEAERRLTISVSQSRSGSGGLFHLPFEVALVGADGQDVEARTLELTDASHEIRFDDVDAPSLVSMNRNASFYGTFEQTDVSADVLASQVRLDPCAFNRVEAMRCLTDQQRIRLIEDPEAAVDTAWLDLYIELLADTAIGPGLKAYLLRIDEQPMQRAHLPNYRACNRVYRHLQRAVAEHDFSAWVSAFNAVDTTTRGSRPRDGLEERHLKATLLETLCSSDCAASQALAENHFTVAWNFSDRLSALRQINRSKHPARLELLNDAYRDWQGHNSAYAGYLSVIASGSGDDVFEAMAREQARDTFDIQHPTLNRALLLPMTRNNDQLWTPQGLDWLARTVGVLAPINEYVANRVVDALQLVHRMPSPLQDDVVACLEQMRKALDAKATPSVAGHVDAYLSGVENGR